MGTGREANVEMVWYDEDTKAAAVIDNGTGYLKGGLAGESEPDAMFRACVGYPKIDPRTGEVPPVIFGEPTQESYVAPSMAQEAFMQMKFPVAHGMIDNWDDMEKIWSHLFHPRAQGFRRQLRGQRRCGR